MANNYLEFSETLGPLTPDQEAWLQQQLEPIIVVKGAEFPEADAPEADEPGYRGLRFLRDYEDLDDDADMAGFGVEFQGKGNERHLWLHAEEGGVPGRAGHLVQKFLKEFQPDQCWSLTYANTCSKACTGEFGGGAVFVTADTIRWNDCYDFVEQQRSAFERRRQHNGRLMLKAKKLGISPEQLDEAVHEAVSSAASAINSGGLDDQIAYLVEQLGPEETEKMIDELPDGEEAENNDTPNNIEEV